MNLYYIGLGSNLGNRADYLKRAIAYLSAESGISVQRGSSVYETKPVGPVAQPDYLNMVLEVTSEQTPPELLIRCLAIEIRLGRVRHERWGPRTIDLDLLISPQSQWADDNLLMPHPELARRAFMLLPLSELAANLPLAGSTVGDLAGHSDQTGLHVHSTWEQLTQTPTVSIS